MATRFSVPCLADDGDSYTLKIDAGTDAEARCMAERQGHRLIGDSPTDFVASAPIPGTELATTAMTLSIAGLLVFPLAFIGIVLGAVAKEKSSGRVGGSAITAGILVLVADLLVAALVLSSVTQ